jgi:hypothetical protein
MHPNTRKLTDRAILPWFLALVALVIVVCTTFAGVASPMPFAYDESDYMYAGFQGIWANFTDRGAMSMVEFVKKGWELSHDSSQRVSVSQYVRASGDISFYRHYHGPVYAYWVGFWHLLGVSEESSFRATNLILHALTAIVIFLLFPKAFPQFPISTAFVAAVMFLLNRTTLITAVSITQHIFFEVLSVIALLALAIYFQTRNVRWWYASVVLLAIAFASVEIAIVLMGAMLMSVIVVHWGEWRTLGALVGKGALWLLGALALVWPKGLFELDVIKGYLYLAYIAIYRKTFSPIGPFDLWGFKIRTYPLEFVLPLVAVLAGLWLWRKSDVRNPLLPFLTYVVMFTAVTMVITAPYAYYHGSLLAAAAIVTGVVYGELWRKTGPALRIAGFAVILASLTFLDIGYYREAKQINEQPSFTRQVLNYLDSASTNGPMYVHYVLVPPLHFYRQELVTVGYDADWTVQRLASEAMAAAPSRVLCADSVCQKLTTVWPEQIVRQLTREPVGHSDDTGEAVYSLSLKRP